MDMNLYAYHAEEEEPYVASARKEIILPRQKQKPRKHKDGYPINTRTII